MAEEAKVIPFPEKKGTPNPVWDACELVLGYAPKTRSEKALWGRMTMSLREADATEDRIIKVAEWYHRRWPDVDLTITALEKWYSHFLALAEKRDKSKAVRAAQTCPECHIGGGFHIDGCSKVNSLDRRK